MEAEQALTGHQQRLADVEAQLATMAASCKEYKRCAGQDSPTSILLVGCSHLIIICTCTAKWHAVFVRFSGIWACHRSVIQQSFGL